MFKLHFSWYLEPYCTRQWLATSIVPDRTNKRINALPLCTNCNSSKVSWFSCICVHTFYMPGYHFHPVEVQETQKTERLPKEISWIKLFLAYGSLETTFHGLQKEVRAWLQSNYFSSDNHLFFFTGWSVVLTGTS